MTTKARGIVEAGAGRTALAPMSSAPPRGEMTAGINDERRMPKATQPIHEFRQQWYLKLLKPRRRGGVSYFRHLQSAISSAASIMPAVCISSGVASSFDEMRGLPSEISRSARHEWSLTVAVTRWCR